MSGHKPNIIMGLPERFWSKAVIDDRGFSTPCLIWAACRSSAGYAKFNAQGNRVEYGHRLAYEALIGPIPEGLVVDHLCRNRACVNPDHLEPVGRGENVMRGETLTAANHIKTHCPQGHEYTPENTRVSKNGHRRCLTCDRARDRARRPSRKASR